MDNALELNQEELNTNKTYNDVPDPCCMNEIAVSKSNQTFGCLLSEADPFNNIVQNNDELRDEDEEIRLKKEMEHIERTKKKEMEEKEKERNKERKDRKEKKEKRKKEKDNEPLLSFSTLMILAIIITVVGVGYYLYTNQELITGGAPPNPNLYMNNNYY